MLERIVIINMWRSSEYPDEDRFTMYKIVESVWAGEVVFLLGCAQLRDADGNRIVDAECNCGKHDLWATANPDGPLHCHIETAIVNPYFRRRRIGMEFMYELERRWPGVTATPRHQDGPEAYDRGWASLKDQIMATGDPHVGRADLAVYVPCEPSRVLTPTLDLSRRDGA
ncbi:MAG TPA: hypothetical protein VGG64_14265 [Pirellulales bacterium]|jgi:hypothetical protein